jgi:hypothetical protein
MKTLRDSGTQREIRERLRQVGPETPRQWGRMTAHQMICHLADSLQGALGGKTLKPVPVPLPRKIMKFIALGLPMQWPHGLKTVPEIDQHENGTRPTEFVADVAGLGSLFERFVSNSRAFAPTHPFFGPMSDTDWMRWGYLHMDHHLRQFGQ